MNKICTTIEQSKKLIELGIDINSADMHYSTWTILNGGEYILSLNQGETIEELQESYGNQVIPAWSLSALLGLMHGVNLYNSGNKTKIENAYRTIRNDISLIDAAFEMVVWLKENGKI